MTGEEQAEVKSVVVEGLMEVLSVVRRLSRNLSEPLEYTIPLRRAVVHLQNASEKLD